MPTWTARTALPGHSAAEIYAWHDRPGAFARLLPPWTRVTLDRVPDHLAAGTSVRFRLHLGPLRWPWEAETVEVHPASGFCDEARRGPFPVWRHVHTFTDGDGRGVLEDAVTWDLPLPPLGRMAAGWFARRELGRMFAWRHTTTAADLTLHARYADRPRLRVGITGATGLVGRELTALLTTGGHTVLPFTRKPADPGTSRCIPWDPATGQLDPRDLEGLDAVVHLAGEPIAARWTPARTAAIRDSRARGTALLARALADCSRPPPTLISASAVGYYGDRREPVDEDSPPGQGFLAEVGAAWEAAARPAVEAGLRVVHPRIGVVLSGRGGALPAMLPAFQLGLGGPLGRGRQGFPWIDLDDLVALLYEALLDDRWQGPVNAVAPEIVDQATFARALGRTLGRPAVVPAPAPAVRALLGGMGQAVLLEGAPVQPTAALAHGFRWRRPDLATSLAAQTGRDTLGGPT